jgi:hypothetical protein
MRGDHTWGNELTVNLFYVYICVFSTHDVPIRVLAFLSYHCLFVFVYYQLFRYYAYYEDCGTRRWIYHVLRMVNNRMCTTALTWQPEGKRFPYKETIHVISIRCMKMAVRHTVAFSFRLPRQCCSTNPVVVHT